MTKQEIINNIAEEKLVEKIVYKLLPCSKNQFDCPEDLVQDIYIILLEKKEEDLQRMYDSKELPFFILRVTRNQLFSVNSTYFYTYIKRSINNETLESAEQIIVE